MVYGLLDVGSYEVRWVSVVIVCGRDEVIVVGEVIGELCWIIVCQFVIGCDQCLCDIFYGCVGFEIFGYQVLQFGMDCFEYQVGQFVFGFEMVVYCVI